MSRTPRRYDAEQIRRFSDTTIAYYDRFARAFWNGTRDHDVNQNYAAFLDAIEDDPPYLPEGGRVRTSPHGIVYFSNSGEMGHGYALCLQCGRAAPEIEPQAATRPLPGDLGDGQGAHRPLRGAPKDDRGYCPGSVGGFSIKRNLSLGHSLRTAVVEVQLYDCRDPDTARAVAIALREACAAELGIDPEEMGFASTPAPNPQGIETWCRNRSR
jgi:hypothetical protein